MCCVPLQVLLWCFSRRTQRWPPSTWHIHKCPLAEVRGFLDFDCRSLSLDFEEALLGIQNMQFCIQLSGFYSTKQASIACSPPLQFLFLVVPSLGFCGASQRTTSSHRILTYLCHHTSCRAAYTAYALNSTTPNIQTLKE